MPAKVIKFRNKDTGHVWDVDQPALAERLDANPDFERVADAPAPVNEGKATEEAAKAEK